MAHTEPWQVFADNGQPILGTFGSRKDFENNKALIMGASHVWIWRRAGSSIEVLFQTRSHTKSTWPSYKDVSAAGHIDQNEDPVVAAVREAKEEIGVDIDPAKLHYIFSLRTPLDSSEIDTVFIYELRHDLEFRFDDGEVESIEWVTLNEFEQIVNEPEKYTVVPQGTQYFGLLLLSLKRISK